jgi:predicted metal-dependent peptidase
MGKAELDLLIQKQRLERAHVSLLKNPKVMLLSGVILLGKSSVEMDVPTAYTDGLNKRYGYKFMQKLTDEQLNGLIMHENGHVFFRHILRGKAMFKEDPRLANMAADFVVNDMIFLLNDNSIQLPSGALWNEMFRGWSMQQVYDYLRKKKEEKPEDGNGPGRGKGKPQDSDSGEGEMQNNHPPKPTDIDDLMDSDSIDEHDYESAKDYDEKEIDADIDRVLRQGAILAGVLGGKTNRAVDGLLEVKVNWREVLRDFISSYTVGKSDYTWRKFNRRLVANDVYMPSTYNETVGEIVVAIDTSGSIGGPELTAFATELVSICETVEPEKVRVVWWDAKVHGEQVFTGSYAGIASMLRPVGGGGTRVSCVSEFLNSKNISAECVIVFTDGYVENNIKWEHQAPVLWLVTQNKGLEVPVGKKVLMEG